MADAPRFIAALRQTLAKADPARTGFMAQAVPAPAPYETVWVWSVDDSGVERRDTWELRYLEGVVGSEDPDVLARWVAERIASGLQRVVLNCDWGHDWPLWAPGSGFYNAEPGDLALSSELTKELRSFHDYWSEHYAFELGWDDASHRDRAQAHAEWLTDRLAAETEGRFAVENGFRYSFR